MAVAIAHEVGDEIAQAHARGQPDVLARGGQRVVKADGGDQAFRQVPALEQARANVGVVAAEDQFFRFDQRPATAGLLPESLGTALGRRRQPDLADVVEDDPFCTFLGAANATPSCRVVLLGKAGIGRSERNFNGSAGGVRGLGAGSWGGSHGSHASGGPICPETAP